MNIESLLLLLLAALGVAALGVLYRGIRSRKMSDMSDLEFLQELSRTCPVTAPPEAILQERRRIARSLGITPEKLTPAQTSDFLSGPLAYMADFSVAWNDLLDEASESREAAGLDQRAEPPDTIGEIIEDLLRDPR